MFRTTLNALEEAMLERRFAHHPPAGDRAERHGAVREACKGAARQVILQTPTGREQSLAMTKLEEAMYWANAAIAREGHVE